MGKPTRQDQKEERRGAKGEADKEKTDVSSFGNKGGNGEEDKEKTELSSFRNRAVAVGHLALPSSPGPPRHFPSCSAFCYMLHHPLNPTFISSVQIINLFSLSDKAEEYLRELMGFLGGERTNQANQGRTG
ncbi:hypothetical protein PS1_035480 [Malus domestica]